MTGAFLEKFMRISDEKTVGNIAIVSNDPSVTSIQFIHVDFTKAVVGAMKSLKGRSFSNIELLSCRGNIDTVLSLVFNGMRVAALRLEDIHLRQSSAKFLGEALAESHTLSHLHLQRQFMSDDVAEAFSYGLRHTLCLKSLLWYNDCSPKSEYQQRIILESLRDNESLRRLGMCRVDNICPAKFLKYVLHHRSLQHLSMTLQQLDPEVLELMEGIPKLHSSRLISVSLSLRTWDDIDILPSIGRIRFRLNFSSKPSREELDRLGKLLQINSSIESLNLGHTGLKDNDVHLLGKFFEKSLSLKNVNLNGCQIHRKGGEYLLRSVQLNQMLESLEFPPNCIHSTRIQHYADLNKGGRKQLTRGNAVPLALWPFLLNRAGKICYQKGSRLFQKDNEIRRANVIYHLLQGPATLDR